MLCSHFTHFIVASSFETDEGIVYENHPRTASADVVYDYDPPRNEAQAVCQGRARRFELQKDNLARRSQENGPFRPLTLPVYWNRTSDVADYEEDSGTQFSTPGDLSVRKEREPVEERATDRTNDCPEIHDDGDDRSRDALNATDGGGNLVDTNDGGDSFWKGWCGSLFPFCIMRMK
ncbi:hypothetical protein FOL47_008998 [Perkinsus chesapeaki]|uniref:Uncharacterized protein n=1 Tax=Perkinsus chesapeaki TaxID=330153 RepID=A0A7J6MTE4_PERCH|nr:hypothetical protein FOL47_008998 [Perkinsus chesapeaki]